MDTIQIIEDVERLEKEITNAKVELASNEGEIKQVYKSALEDYGVNSVKEAQTKIGKNENELKKVNVLIEKKYDNLCENWEW